MNYPVPLVGLKGQFKFYAPFNTALNEVAVYKTTGVRTIPDLLNDDVDVLNIIYLNQGLSKESYDKDLAEETPIVILQSEGGSLFYVPARYIKTLPNLAGEVYVGKGMFINLGNLPVNKDIDYLKDELTDIIKSIIGLEPKITMEEITSKFVVPYNKHDELEAERAKTITNTETCFSRLFKTQKVLENTKNKLKLLLQKFSKIEENKDNG